MPSGAMPNGGYAEWRLCRVEAKWAEGKVGRRASGLKGWKGRRNQVPTSELIPERGS